jgi:hypothetical protein
MSAWIDLLTGMLAWLSAVGFTAALIAGAFG